MWFMRLLWVLSAVVYTVIFKGLRFADGNSGKMVVILFLSFLPMECILMKVYSSKNYAPQNFMAHKNYIIVYSYVICIAEIMYAILYVIIITAGLVLTLDGRVPGAVN